MENVWKIIDKYFEDNPQSLVRHHVESYNDFMKNGIFQIFKEKNPIVLNTEYDESIDDYRYKCHMYMGGKDGTKVYFGKPVIYDENDNVHYMYPNEARLRNMTYGMTVHYDIDVEFTHILREGEMPQIVGGGKDIQYVEDETITAAGGKDADFNYKEAAATVMMLNEDEEEDKQISGGGGGAGGASGPPQRRQKRKTLAQQTPADIAFIREATERSMVAPNVQKQTMVLEKVYLGKFPIMIQSDYCVLTGFPREIRHTMGECRNDMGGYFIIDGKEKTVVSQEKFADNMLYIRDVNDEHYLYSAEIRSVSENVSKPIRTISVKIVAPGKTDRSYTNKNIVVNIPNVRKPVPLFIVFRALGILSDKDIISMCLLDIDKHEAMVDLFIPSVYDAGGILTQSLALKYIATFTKGKTVAHSLEILSDYFFPHIGEVNFQQKAYYLGYVVFRLLSVYNGTEPATDRDNYKYKRIELVGSLMYDLFREYYTLQQRHIHLKFEEQITYNPDIYARNLMTLIQKKQTDVFSERIVEAGFKKAFKGNWGSQEHTKRIGIVQDLNRLSFNSAMSHLRKTNLPLDSSVKLVGPRVLHATQWGYFDPIDTPDGANIGLQKHMSITTHITQGYSREPMLKWLREKINMRLLEDCSPLLLSKMTKVFVNGLFAGGIEDPMSAIEKMKMFRRNGLIPIYTSVSFNVKQNTVFIYTDAGRPCRPIFYMDNDTDKISYDREHILEKLTNDEFSWNEMIAGFNPKKKSAAFNLSDPKIYEFGELYQGMEEKDPDNVKRFNKNKAILDYIDPSETEDALIAVQADDLTKDENKKYTHLEIHESLIFGMMCNLITFPENNPATRNSFSCGQSKQACSLYHTNYQVRMDKTAVVLNYGQAPLVKTRYLEHINHEENPYGENAIVAIMCYTGYNVEDAILINEGALQRGLFRTTYYSTYETHEEKVQTGDASVDKIFTNIENETDVVGTKPGYDYSQLDKFGIIRENTEVNDKTVLIGLTATSNKAGDKKVDMSKTPKKGQLGVVDKAFITEGNEGFRIAKVKVREQRIPNLGDKMASRNGQKGTIGLVIPEANMPFTKNGVRPDMIINPHALPSRQTIGQLVECITGKSSLVYGAFADCTAFNNRGSKIKVFGEILSKVGYHSSGNEILYNGMTGEQIETEIFMGPTYYMRLKHMVKDKINFRALGPRNALTRQPVGGRANDGGLRIGEMERDSVISHGIGDFLRESMMERGDKYYMAVCNTTGLLAIYNPSKSLFISPMADGPIKFSGSLDGKTMNIENVTKFGRDFSVVCVPYSLKLLIQELQTINVQMRIITEDNIHQIENMTFSKNIEKLVAVGTTPRTVIMNTQNILKKGSAAAAAAPKTLMENIWEVASDAIESMTSSTTPEEAPPAEEAELSPQYPDFSPAYEPSPSELGPQTSPSSPQYIPKSETTSPIEESRGGTPGDYLSEAASRYSVGDAVYYRGDPTRLWNVTNVGDKFLRIETNDYRQGSDDNLKIVSAMDIYPADNKYEGIRNDNVFENPQGGVSSQGEYQQDHYQGIPSHAMMPGGGGGGVPHIHFSPVIKVTGGSDFSTGGAEVTTSGISGGGNGSVEFEPSPVQAVMQSAIDNNILVKKSTGDEVSGGGSAAPPSDAIDFSRLVIKKRE